MTLPPRERQLIRSARLRYVSDSQPGWRRQRAGRGFIYLNQRGSRLQQSEAIERIQHLGIPPAWTDVWICPWENGHLQSTGHDQRARKQYLYHPKWREAAERFKFSKLIDFGEALPTLRRRVSKLLREPEWSRAKLIALAVRLLDRLAIRVGSAEYARDNETYGLTTLRSRHVQIQGSEISIDFVGKSNKQHHLCLRDPRLAGLLADLKSQRTGVLLGYRGERGQVTVTAADINEFLQQGDLPHTAKDFRVWRGSVLALETLTAQQKFGVGGKRAIMQALRASAEVLGNTVTVCRKHYVHPGLVNPQFVEVLSHRLWANAPLAARGYSQSERALLHVLRRLAKTGF